MPDSNLLTILLENTTDGVIILDSDGRIAHMNPASQHRLGISTKDFLNQPQTALIAPLLHLTRDQFRRQNREDALRQFFSRFDPAEIKVSIDISPSVSAEMTIKRLLVDSQIVLLLQTTQEEIQNAMWDSVDELLGGLRHDLKHHTTAIKGYASVFSAPKFYEQLMRDNILNFLDIIVQNIHQLDNFTNHWADIVSLEVAGNPLSRSTAAGGKWAGINGTTEGLKGWIPAFIESKKQEFKVRIQENLPEVKFYDDNRLGYMIDYLVERASRESQEEMVITLAIRLNEDKNAVQFTVSDQGSPIDEGTLASLESWSLFRNGFEKLAWTKLLTEANGGDFWIESHEEVGTSVHFTLPLVTSSQD